MKEVLNILKKKKIQFFFLFYILLLVPVLCPLAENFTFLDKVAVFIVCGSLFSAILVISLFISSKLERVIYSILLAISIIPGSIFLAYLLFAHVMLEQNSVTSLFETNPEESREFVAHYLSLWVIAGVVLYAAIPIVMVCTMKSFKPLKIKNHKYLFTISIVIILCIVGINRVSRSVYFINIYKTFISYKLRTNYEIKTIKERPNHDYTVENKYQDTIPQTIIIIIGESLNKHHMSLYGYSRNTNPLLSEYGDSLIIYQDAVAPQVHTIPVMRSVLSMSERGHPEYFTEKPSLFELFNRADYNTYLISNQEFSEDCKSSYDILLTLAKTKYNVAKYKQHDDIVLPVLDKILEEDKTKHKLILIHLIGNHMAYEFRYPKEYIIFNYTKDGLVPDAPYRDDKAKRTIDRFDNSVLFNDYIVSSIIKTMNKEKKQNTAVIYFSDHGEELYDYREFAGHAYEKVSPSMSEIPFMLWMSSTYIKKRKDLIFDINRPFSTEDFIYSISDLAGLEYKDYQDERSLFSKEFIKKERYVGEKKYEDIKKRFKGN
ncbi:sulfatase-like hydrolase/transferase [Dysgonomonas sp. Marseille-P4677]|uniref:sulfatase-like hydrolase/transferase n=1 Tax=Dysgonomonas sp. Marseille-P4677 TaxID=2364790 RepID=UPI0019144C98|nr:sulfatase-like hydrolase/transferase [Dysgonomonas sp. Marseille-P4677]MBK5722885.1 sulfatase-like hydrolase/transferase [Dysgonomonas sp. Marseille-P4677]